jgi:hypothetical protein
MNKRLTKPNYREGRKPYGYKPGEREVIARMKVLQEQGLNVLRITQQLNSEGLKPRKAEHWHPHSVARILARTTTATAGWNFRLPRRDLGHAESYC